jgi:hypothetical protein
MYHAVPRSISRSITRGSTTKFKPIYSGFINYQKRSITMATPRKVQLSPEDAGVFSLAKPTAETAQTASRILQENHEVNIILDEKGGKLTRE